MSMFLILAFPSSGTFHFHIFIYAYLEMRQDNKQEVCGFSPKIKSVRRAIPVHQPCKSRRQWAREYLRISLVPPLDLTPSHNATIVGRSPGQNSIELKTLDLHLSYSVATGQFGSTLL